MDETPMRDQDDVYAYDGPNSTDAMRAAVKEARKEAARLASLVRSVEPALPVAQMLRDALRASVAALDAGLYTGDADDAVRDALEFAEALAAVLEMASMERRNVGGEPIDRIPDPGIPKHESVSSLLFKHGLDPLEEWDNPEDALRYLVEEGLWPEGEVYVPGFESED